MHLCVQRHHDWGRATSPPVAACGGSHPFKNHTWQTQCAWRLWLQHEAFSPAAADCHDVASRADVDILSGGTVGCHAADAWCGEERSSQHHACCMAHACVPQWRSSAEHALHERRAHRTRQVAILESPLSIELTMWI